MFWQVWMAPPVTLLDETASRPCEL